MRDISKLHNGWIFHSHFTPDLIFQAKPGQPVRLPHNAVDLEMSYLDERSYQQAFCYQRNLAWRPEFSGREISLEFDGAMSDAVVWINGRQVAAHADGYTPFSARLTGLLVSGDNLITVKVDGSENPSIPPFGGQIDYLTYAGIYRDVWLKQTDAVSIARIKVEPFAELSHVKGLRVRGWLDNPTAVTVVGNARVELCSLDGAVLYQTSTPLDKGTFEVLLERLTGLQLWELDAPQLYQVRVHIDTTAGCDTLSTRFGFRTARFTNDGFFLNNKPLKILGLNRHQSFPYVGYAMGQRAQARDADILKEQLHCNLVRTSHYPQSPYFLDRCDEIGLLVFEEIPGWQHIGDAAWQEASVENVRAMVQRDWNHPSIILWGVRINESPDNHDFYARTNAMARALDPTRQTGGVRCIENSELLEDVYTINDFFNGAGTDWLAGRDPVALRMPRAITGLDHDVPYLVTEFNGHMYPTKRIDPEQRQAEHVTRYLQVLNQAWANPAISGTIGWCMSDYNTHKDFGAGDRICHHGVMDIFREPKFAAHVYRSQCDPATQVVLEPVTYWARGERDRCEVLPLIVLTNCDYVDLQFAEYAPQRALPDRTLYPHLPHPPVIFDSRHINPQDLGAWGMLWRDASLTGYIDGKPVASVALCGNPLPTRLQVIADDTELRADEKDATRVIVRALDQVGRVLPFLDDVIGVEVLGPARLLGPAQLPIKGGVTGFWVETTGEAGEIVLRVSSLRLGSQTLSLRAHEKYQGHSTWPM